MLYRPERARWSMNFIALVKWKGKPNREAVDETIKMREAAEKIGIHSGQVYWTLGRYDAVALFEAPDEKAAMKNAISWSNLMEIETLVAIPVEEARKLVE